MTQNQQNHIGNSLIFMCRYSFGRKTSADMASVSALKALWNYVPDNHKRIIKDEIEMELDVVHDSTLWKEFLEWSKK